MLQFYICLGIVLTVILVLGLGLGLKEAGGGRPRRTRLNYLTKVMMAEHEQFEGEDDVPLLKFPPTATPVVYCKQTIYEGQLLSNHSIAYLCL